MTIQRKKNKLPAIVEAFAQQVARSPDAIAIVFHTQSLSYRELDRKSNQLARWMIRRLGDRVLGAEELLIPLCFAPGIERIVATLAILKLGGAYVPIDPDFPISRMEYMLEDIQAQFILTDSGQGPALQKLEMRHPLEILETDGAKAEIDQMEETGIDLDISPESLCYVMYTSGTTGKPKGVMVCHQGVTRLVLDTDYIHIQPEDGISQMSNIAFDAATFEIWGALLNGARLIIVDKETALNAALLSRSIREQQITVMFLTTGLFNQHISADKECFHGLRYLLFGGEAASINAVRTLMSAENPPEYLLHVYGPTENTTFSTCRYLTEMPGEGSFVSIGKAIRHSTVVVVDQHMETVEEGELLVGGLGLARGYLNQPELTAAKFIDNPFGEGKLYRTGDIVRRLESGDLVFVGRVDNQVKIRGFRIELEEIEGVLESHADIDGAALVVYSDGAADTKRLGAFLKPRAGKKLPSVENIRAHLLRKLPAYMLPALYYQVDNFPLSHTGKVDRKTLQEQGGKALPQKHSSHQPKTKVEEQLAELWARQFQLPLQEIGAEDDFFMLGGDSLTAIQLLITLKREYGLEIPVKAIFEYPTIRSLADYISNKQPSQSTEIPAGAGTGPLALSPYQESIWLHQQLAPGVPLYNEPLSITIPEPIDLPHFKAALTLLLNRHEALRSRFKATPSGPVQCFEKAALPENFAYYDLRHLPKAPRESEALFLATAQAGKRFDLAKDQPIRFCLVRLEEARYRLYLVAHHLVIDGVAIYQVFLPELEQVYRSLAAGNLPELPDLAVRYSDWVAWIQEGQKEIWETEKAYWRQKLTDYEPVRFPTDKKPAESVSFAGARYCLDLPAGLTTSLRELSKKSGVSLFMTLLTAFKLLLNRYTQQKDLSIASVLANRHVAGTEQMVANFVNTLLLRTRLPDNGTFLDALNCVQKTCLEAYAHQNIPFQQVVQALKEEEDLGNIGVAFVLEPTITPGCSWELSQLDVHTDTAKFGLTMELDEREDRIIGRVEYRTDLYEESTIARLVHLYQVLLDGIVQAPQKPYWELPLLTPQEKQQMLNDWNDNEVNYDGGACLHPIIEKQVDLNPSAKAVISENEALSYAELDHRANQLAHHLVDLGIAPDQIVVVWTDRSADHIVALLAVLKAGAAYAPLGAEDPTDRVAFIVEDTQTPILICDAAHRNRLPKGNFQIVDVDADRMAISKRSSDRPALRVKGENLAYVIYTSGSTGKPKGVLVEHRQIADRTHWAAASLRLNTGDVFLHLFSLAFDAAVVPTWWALNQGATLLMPAYSRLQDMSGLASLVSQYQVSTISATPSVMSALVKILAQTGYAGLRLLTTGGESLSKALFAQMKVLAPRVINYYGPTEATVVATEWDGSRQEDQKPPIGWGIANTRIYVLDAHQKLVPAGVPGELYIGGMGVTRGYLNRPDLTEKHFHPDPFVNQPGSRMYRTGDMVRYLPSGEIDFLGRADSQVKIRGFRIELGEIESVLNRHESVEACAVIVRKNKMGIAQLLAYYVARAGSDQPDQVALKDFLAQKLPAHMRPAALIGISALPLTPNGKLDVKALPDRPQEIPSKTAMLTPRTELERQLHQLWAEVLDIDKMDIRQDFFDLGGNSLLSIQLVARAQEQGLPLSIKDLLEYPTIAGSAEHLALLKDAENYHTEAPRYLTFESSSTSRAATHQHLQDYMGEPKSQKDRIITLKSGKQPALFFVHPAGGSAFCYRELAAKIGNDQAFYGLETSRDISDESIENLAKVYLQLVKEQQPEGPYFLGGWSLGGLIAFEMSSQLEAIGEKVELLTIIDSVLPSDPEEQMILAQLASDNACLLALISRDLQLLSKKAFSISYEDILAQHEAEREAWYVQQLLQQGIFSQEIIDHFVLPFLRSFQASARLVLDYQPNNCQADILLLRAQDSSNPVCAGLQNISVRTPLEKAAYWQLVCQGDFKLRVVPGVHENMIFDPYVDKIAEEIALALEMHKVQKEAVFTALEGLDQRKWETFLQEATLLHFSPGETLIKQGAKGRHLLLISEGFLKVYHDLEDREERLGIVGPNTVIGELAFLDGHARTASIAALTTGRAYLLTPGNFARLAKRDPQLAMSILMDVGKVVSSRFRTLDTKIG